MKRKIEIFTAGCPVCEAAVSEIKKEACPSCELEVLDVNNKEAFERSKRYGVKSLPSVVINEKLAECCAGNGVDINVLKKMGLGRVT